MAALKKRNKRENNIGIKTEAGAKTKSSIYFMLALLSISLIAAIVIRLYAVGMPVTDKWTASVNAADKENISEQLKDVYKDKNGDYYLYGVDSYNYLKEAEDIPKGGQPSSLLPYLEFYFYRFLAFFDSHATIIKAAFWLPFIFSLLSIILIFFIARKLTNDIGGFFASFLLAINPQFFTATQPGFADTNFLNLFFSILVVFLLFEAVDFRSRIKSIVCFALLIPSLYLFRLAWTGYYYIIFIIFTFILLYLVYFLIRKTIKTGSKKYIVWIIITLIAISAVYINIQDRESFKNMISNAKIKIGLTKDWYHNVATSFTTELFSASKAVEYRGKGENPYLYVLNGYIYAALVILSALLLIYNNIKPDRKTKYLFFILFWAIVMFCIGYTSIRFISFMTIPMSILIAYGLSAMLDYLVKRQPDIQRSINFAVPKNIFYVASILLLSLLVLIPVIPALSERVNRTPMMNDLIEAAGQKVFQDSSEGAIVNIWWDKGYLYRYYTGRDVLMHNGVGGSFDPRMYWMSRALLSTDEQESLSIFKMMDCGKWDNNPDIDLSTDFCTPPESYLILDNNVAGKLDIFSYFTDVYNNEGSEFNAPKIPAVSLSVPCSVGSAGKLMTCGNEFKITLQSNLIPKLDYNGNIFPVSVVMNEFTISSVEKGPYTLLVYPTDVSYNAALVRSDLLDSMFVRLYFKKGLGLEHFKPLVDISNPVSGRVVAYKIEW